MRHAELIEALREGVEFLDAGATDEAEELLRGALTVVEARRGRVPGSRA